MHIACKEGHINVIQSLLLQGADTTIKNNKCKTPLDECRDTNKDEIVSLFSKYNPKRGKVLSNNSIILMSQEESKQLAFIRAKGPPPYKFECDQVFGPYDNFGVVKITDLRNCYSHQKNKEVSI